MTISPKSYELLVEEGGVLTLPEEAIRHLGCEPGIEAQLECDVLPDGSVVILPILSAAARPSI